MKRRDLEWQIDVPIVTNPLAMKQLLLIFALAPLLPAALLALGYSLGVTAYLLRLKPAWIPIAVRVAGSWITAIGVLALGIGGRTLNVG